MKLNKKNISIVGALILAVSLIIIFNMSNSKVVNSSEDEEKLVRLVLSQYKTALINHDVDYLVKFSLDLSWPDQKQFKENIKNLDEKIYKFETVSTKKVEQDLYHATVLAETESMTETKLDIPVLYLNGQWKVIVGQDLDENQQNNSSANATSKTIKSASFYKEYFTNLKR